MRNPILSLLKPFRSPPFFSQVYPTSRNACKPLHNHNQIRGLSCTLIFKSQTPRNDTSLHHLYEPIEGTEKLESYRVGGYHPIAIGDQFHDRYRVIHKLGHGTYSTVWLAQDQKFNRYVAVKVCTADSNLLELDVLSELSSPQQSQGTSLGRTMIPSVLDAFHIHGPNGTHACYVTTPARMSLSEAKDGSYNRLFQLEVARALAAQLAVAVGYVHSQGVVHGDLHYGNILLQLPYDLDQFSVEELYQKYGEPQLEPIRRFDGKPLPLGIPSHAVIPIWFGEASDKLELPEAKILLADFGEAFSPAKQQNYESRTPLINRPPEVRFEPHKSISFPSDIWSLGCSIWNIIAQSPLFDSFVTSGDDLITEQVDALGILPWEWWYQWEGRHGRFTEDGKPINRKPYRSWEDRFEDSVQQPRQAKGMPAIDSAERDAMFSMLQSMLVFRPESRPTAKQILGSEWMVKWALPEFEKCRIARGKNG